VIRAAIVHSIRIARQNESFSRKANGLATHRLSRNVGNRNVVAYTNVNHAVRRLVRRYGGGANGAE